MTETTTTQLPAAVRAFLAAHAERDAGAATTFFTSTAEVTDEGRTVRGTEAIAAFVREGGAEFEYTTEVTGVRRVDDARWDVTHHLEGDFPGGVVDLDYRFTLADDLIAELVIAPS